MDLDVGWLIKGFYVFCQIVVMNGLRVAVERELPFISSDIIRIWIYSLWPIIVERMFAYVFAILMEKQVQNKYP